MFINAHAPMEDKENDIEEELYQTLEHIYNSTLSNDITLMLGDLNVKVGKEAEYLGTIGKHNLHDEFSGNGKRLIDFAISKNMIIS